MSSVVTPEAALLHLLLFSVGGVSFGVDLEQIDGMAGYAGETDPDLHWLHDLLGYGDLNVSYRWPTVLSVKALDNQSYRVVIDGMEEIAEYRWSEITPFPALLEPRVLSYGIWGVVQREGQLVLLLDFQRSAETVRNVQSRTVKEY